MGLQRTKKLIIFYLMDKTGKKGRQDIPIGISCLPPVLVPLVKLESGAYLPFFPFLRGVTESHN
jgi:hypothetical protein